MAASRMSPAEFTHFSLLALTGSILLGLNVAGLLQPALINQRQLSNSYVPFRYVLLTSVGSSSQGSISRTGVVIPARRMMSSSAGLKTRTISASTGPRRSRSRTKVAVSVPSQRR
jgi:hypothetical protein